MMDEKIKVLNAIAGPFTFGGVEAFIYNIYNNIDREQIQLDIIVPEIKNTDSADRIIKLGGNVFSLNLSKNVFLSKYQIYRQTKEIIKKHNYKIIHIQTGSRVLISIYAMAAKKCGVKTIIAHSHNTGLNLNKYKRAIVTLFTKYIIKNYPTHYFACSELAGTRAFGKKLIDKIKVINNGIYVQKYIFNTETRCKIRNELKINNSFVVGHIGRFCKQKNTLFLINIFSEILKKDKTSILLLVGAGEDEQKIVEEAKKLNIYDNIIFYGETDKTEELYQAMDVFLLPSLYEGLPIVGIEAQASGLKIVFSNAITKETAITKNCEFISLDESPTEWAKKILKYKDSYNRKNMSNEIIKAGYDIKRTAKILEDIYLSSAQIK